MTGTDNDTREVSQQAYAISALVAAGQRDSTRAAIDSLHSAAITYGADYASLFAQLRGAFPKLGS